MAITEAAQELNAFGYEVDERYLLVQVLIEQEVELIKRRACDLPVMLLVQIAQRHRVGENPVQRFADIC